MYSPALTFPVSSQHSASCRRARLKEHFVQVAVEVLTGYDTLSDGARLTYLVLLSFDYLDPEQGDHKGIVFPSIETLMAKRNKSRSTIYSHLTELEAHGLIAPIPGVGWRLYNPPEEVHNSQQIKDSPTNRETVTDNYRPRQTPAPTSLPSADIPPVPESFAGTPEFRKSGQAIIEEEEEITLPKQIQYSVAGESKASETNLVVKDLEKFGFAPWLARKFIQQYGAKRVRQQLVHLASERSRGVPIQNCARWLYRAIERDYQFPQEPPQARRNRQKTRYEIGALVTLPSGEVIYEMIEQEKAVLDENPAVPSSRVS